MYSLCHQPVLPAVFTVPLPPPVEIAASLRFKLVLRQNDERGQYTCTHINNNSDLTRVPGCDRYWAEVFNLAMYFRFLGT